MNVDLKELDKIRVSKNFKPHKLTSDEMQSYMQHMEQLENEFIQNTPLWVICKHLENDLYVTKTCLANNKYDLVKEHIDGCIRILSNITKDRGECGVQLSLADKKYLKAVSNCFGYDIKSIEKHVDANNTSYVYLSILFHNGIRDDFMTTPSFKADSRFKELILDKKYDLDGVNLDE